MWNIAASGKQNKASGAIEVGSFDLDGMIDYAQQAEKMGIEQLLMGIGFHVPDPLAIVGSLIRATKSIKFMIAYRAGTVSPTTFVQIINTLSTLGDDRISINMLAGISPAEQKYYGDFLAKEKRHERLEEFLEVINEFWSQPKPVDYEGDYYTIEKGQLKISHVGSHPPGLYVSGNSNVSRDTALRQGATWLRYGNTLEQVAENIKPAVAAGVDVGLRMSVIVRPTREEVLTEIDNMMQGADEDWAKAIKDYVANCDSTAVKSVFDLAANAKDDWLDDVLWSGAIPFRGGPALAMAGDADQVADYIMKYKAAGVSAFILSGWPQLQEMAYFTELVIPRVRALEAEQQKRQQATTLESTEA